jgi:hypothetical protein
MHLEGLIELGVQECVLFAGNHGSYFIWEKRKIE